MAQRREDAIIALSFPIFTVIPAFHPIIPAFHPIIPAFHPVIPAKAGIQIPTKTAN